MLSTTYIKINLLKAVPGKLPVGSQYGTYVFVTTSEAACNTFSTSNVLNNFVVAQPFSIVSSFGDAPFGIPFNKALALTCAADGTSVILDAWISKLPS